MFLKYSVCSFLLVYAIFSVAESKPEDMDPLEINWPQSEARALEITIERKVDGLIEAIPEEEIELNNCSKEEVEVELEESIDTE